MRIPGTLPRAIYEKLLAWDWELKSDQLYVSTHGEWSARLDEHGLVVRQDTRVQTFGCRDDALRDALFKAVRSRMDNTPIWNEMP